MENTQLFDGKQKKLIPLEDFVELKCPHFEDFHINHQLRKEVTPEALSEDFFSNAEIYTHFEKYLVTLLKTNKKVEKIFEKYKVRLTRTLLISFLTRRKFLLIHFLISIKHQLHKIKFEKLLEVEFHNINVDSLYNLFKKECSSMGYLVLEIEREEIDVFLKKHIDEEKMILAMKTNSSLFSISVCLKYMKSLVENALNLGKILEMSAEDEKAVEFLLILRKLEEIYSLIHIAYLMDDQDLFNYPESHDSWINLKKYVDTIVLFSKFSVQNKMKKVISQVNLANAAVSRGYQIKDDFLRSLGLVYYFLYYILSPRSALHQTNLFYLSPDAETARKIWNLQDTKPIAFIARLAFPKIAFRKKLYLKRTAKKIDLDRVLYLVENYKSLLKRGEELKKSVESHEFIGETLVEKVTKYNRRCYVEVNLLFSEKLIIPRFELRNPFRCFNFQIENRTRNTLIIHIHGGGFVAMSPSSHENYLRKWVNKLQVPLISINYGLAPENRYPKALDDCFQAYKWIISYCEQELEMRLDQIVVVGDSAGGHLSIGLSYLSILHGLRVPDALFLFYPSVACHIDLFSPSFLLSLNDPILPYHFLKFCLDAYTGNYFNRNDFFLSPIYAPNEIIQRLPYTRIFGGTSDPLRDDILRFTKLLIDNKVDCRYMEFKYFPHGFLNYDVPNMMPEVGHINDIVCEEFEKFIIKGRD